MVADGRVWRPRRPSQTPLHAAVRAGWPEVRADLAERTGVPRRVRVEVARYLGCGDVRRGFVQVRCGSCRRTELVAFSCKQRGLCPSCGARRSHETAAYCGEVLPEVPWRQWTLSMPYRLRWVLVKRPELLRLVERRLVRAVWRWQRRRARGLGMSGELHGGAVGFTQYFGSALQLTPHHHVLFPEGLWDEASGFVALPPPSAEDVEAVLRRVLRQLAKDLEEVESPWPEDDFEGLVAQAAQQRLQWVDEPDTRRRPRRLAVLEGFSLHADTWVHERDRQGLERLCRYGSRGPVALERLSVREDGRYAYRTRKGQVLVFTAEQLVKRLIALLPPAKVHLTRFHGVFAPNARLRSRVMRRPQELVPEPTSAVEQRARKRERPRLDWASLQRRTFEADVWACPCGGRRRVLAVVTSRRTAEEVLGNLGLLPRPLPLPASQSPPQQQLAL